MTPAQKMERRRLSVTRDHGAAPEVVDLRPADWPRLRVARLEALKESPHAFVTSLANERKLQRRDWIQSIDSSTWIAVWQHDKIVGIARSLATEEAPRARYIESVWVAPRYRRQGLVREMVRRLEERARRQGADRLMLWVLDTNPHAWQAYLRLGFEYDRTVLETKKKGRDGEFVKERRMVKRLSCPRSDRS